MDSPRQLDIDDCTTLWHYANTEYQQVTPTKVRKFAHPHCCNSLIFNIGSTSLSLEWTGIQYRLGEFDSQVSLVVNSAEVTIEQIVFKPIVFQIATCSKVDFETTTDCWRKLPAHYDTPNCHCYPSRGSYYRQVQVRIWAHNAKYRSITRFDQPPELEMFTGWPFQDCHRRRSGFEYLQRFRLAIEMVSGWPALTICDGFCIMVPQVSKCKTLTLKMEDNPYLLKYPQNSLFWG